MTSDEDVKLCPRCDKPEGTFACKVQHIQINSGAAKASRDVDWSPKNGDRWKRAADAHHRKFD